MNLDIITPELHDLRKCFQAAGFDLRFVGGVVRDMVRGDVPKDIDLCTDADPEEQKQIYNQNNISHHLTGFEHGTITVVLNNVPYEITSLRLDVETDGRRATVAYTRDWIEDLKRRDLTFNAMSLTFDGELIDPFNGREDLERGIVRFVGDPAERIREDYLRILRWFRFVGRFGSTTTRFYFDNPAWDAIYYNRFGLANISRERVWSEIKAILKQETGSDILNEICHAGIADQIDMPIWNGNLRKSVKHCRHAWNFTKSPEILMLAWTGWDERSIATLADKWKWSNAERAHVNWIINHIWLDRDLRYLIAVENAPRKWVAELAAIEERDAWEQQALVHWVFNPFPVDGNDLIKRGCKPGPQMGKMLRNLKDQWADSGYVASKEELLSTI